MTALIIPSLIRHAAPERLETARLRLARDAVEDAEAVLTAALASHAELTRWQTWLVPGYDLAEARRGQRRAREYWDAGDSFQWRMWWRASAAPRHELVGSIDLHTIDWDDRTAELGYWLDTRYVGRGLAREAGQAVVAAAFELLGFAELAVRCHPDNARSLATARGLGFAPHTPEGDGTVVLRRRAG